MTHKRFGICNKFSSRYVSSFCGKVISLVGTLCLSQWLNSRLWLNNPNVKPLVLTIFGELYERKYLYHVIIHQERKKSRKKFLFLQLMVGCMNSNYYNPKVWQNYSWYLTFDVIKRTMKKKISNPPPIEYWCGFNIGEY